MKKLTLDLDGLVVESFAAGNGAGLRGTVKGHDDITQNCGDTQYCTLGSSCDGSCYASCGDPDCGSYYCTGDLSCAATQCDETCGNSCAPTCFC